MKPLRLFVAALGAEVNTFAPLPIGLDHFSELALFQSETLPKDRPPPLIAAPLQRAWELEREGEAVVTQGLCAGAQPGGVVGREAYETLRAKLLNDLSAAVPVDAVILGLHGATVAHGYDDCEGDLLERVRAVVGDKITISALLDSHCHLSDAMLAHADILMAYKEYPHTDIFEIAARLVDATIAAARGQTHPTMAVVDCGMLGVLHTTREPGAGLIRALRETQARPGVIDVSIAHGFPWGDVADGGMKVWAVTDGDSELAQQLSEDFAQRLRSIRNDMRSPITSARDAIAALRPQAIGLTVLADSADNPGGGAPGDATFLVRALLEAGIEDFAAGWFWDPIAVTLCEAAGEGAELPLRVGGKASRLSGEPLDLYVRVKRIVRDAYQDFAGSRWPVGTAVSIETDAAAFVLTSNRAQCFDAALFQAVGIDLKRKRAVVVKSSQHFVASFGPLAGQILHIEGEGALGDVAGLPFARLTRPIWPLDPLPAPQKSKTATRPAKNFS